MRSMELRGHVRKYIPPSASKRGRGDKGGYGFITADGNDYHVRLNDIIEGQLRKGGHEHVAFEGRPAPSPDKLPIAIKVRVLA